MDERILHIQHCMYQYSRAIYRSIKDLIDPYVDQQTHLEYRREVLAACEGTMERLAADPHYFAKPDRALFDDIRRYFPITVQAQVAWAVSQGVDAAVGFVEEQIEAGAFDGGVARAGRRRARASRASARRCRNATTARPISISSAVASLRDARARAVRPLGSDGARESRHRQADPSALAGRVPDGGAPTVDRA